MGQLNVPDIRRVGRTVAWRRANGSWIPAKMSAVGSGSSATLQAADGAAYTGSKRVVHSDVNVWDNRAR